MLTIEKKRQLEIIQPSHDKNMNYYPCSVTLNNGEVIENVYIVSKKDYIKYWGPISTNKPNIYINIDDIKFIQESPNRLPVAFANKVYDADESGMGYYIFKILFDTGQTLNVITGDAVDFVPTPEGLTVNDIVEVLPHQGSTEDYIHGLSYRWCLC